MTSDPIDLSPLEGWISLGKLTAPTRSFVSGDPDGDRLRLRYYLREADRAFVGRVWFGPAAEGPPGCVHGGAMAAILDEAMGGAAWLTGHQVVAAEINVRFVKMMPLQTMATVEAWVDVHQGRKVETIGRLISAEGDLFSEARGIFVELELERFGEDARDLLDEFSRTWSGKRTDK